MQTSQHGTRTRCHHTIASYETDFLTKLRLSALLNLFQELANQSANALGFGYQKLLDKECIWVLSRLELQLAEMPAWGDEVVLETWPKGVDGLFARRDWQVKRTDGTLLVTCTSAWLLVDLHSRRPLRIHQRLSGFEFPDSTHALDSPLHKLEVAPQPEAIWQTTARYADLDQNRHVNNVRYVDWMMNAFDTAHLNANQLIGFELNILAEVQEDDQISLHRGALTQGGITLAVLNHNGQKAATAKTLWKPR